MRASFAWLAVFLTTVCVFFLFGCASTPKEEQPDGKVSTLPWNTPQNWEKSTPIGGGVGY